MNSTNITKVGGSGRKLFSYYMKENVKAAGDQKMFYYRVNRWRWNSKDNTTGIQRKMHNKTNQKLT